MTDNISKGGKTFPVQLIIVPFIVEIQYPTDIAILVAIAPGVH